MPAGSRQPADSIKRARERIANIRAAIDAVDYLCSGTLVRRTKLCGSPRCACATDPNARHGPYYEWGHMKGGKPVTRMVSPRQATALRHAIANYRKVKALLRDWEAETERLIDLEHPRSE
ncbi:MAG: DUF6788 family protein [Vulcanimicrobiaceae bacterium]|jgi:hypothetical protein